VLELVDGQLIPYVWKEFAGEVVNHPTLVNMDALEKGNVY